MHIQYTVLITTIIKSVQCTRTCIYVHVHTCTTYMYVRTYNVLYILSTILQVHKRTSCTYEHAQLHVSTCTCMYMHVSMNIPHKYHTHS